MRISGGLLAGKSLNRVFPPSVKPTTDLAREALMHVLETRVDLGKCRVLDLYSGSGIVSLEFLSRGALVHSVDNDAGNIRFYQQLDKTWKLPCWTYARADVATFLKQTPPQRYDIIFADPPYNLPGLHTLPELSLPWLNAQGLFIMEHKPELLFPGIQPFIQKQYGKSMFSFFHKTG
jgi:16S rRNA (guanine966-N2)-methyltransferase